MTTVLNVLPHSLWFTVVENLDFRCLMHKRAVSRQWKALFDYQLQRRAIALLTEPPEDFDCEYTQVSTDTFLMYNRLHVTACKISPRPLTRDNFLVAVEHILQMVLPPPGHAATISIEDIEAFKEQLLRASQASMDQNRGWPVHALFEFRLIASDTVRRFIENFMEERPATTLVRNGSCSEQETFRDRVDSFACILLFLADPSSIHFAHIGVSSIADQKVGLTIIRMRLKYSQVWCQIQLGQWHLNSMFR